MGHDISAYTGSGEKIDGIYFSRFCCPHYEYLGFQHRNAGISGDGGSEEVTVDHLRRVLKKVLADLYCVQDGLEESMNPESKAEESKDPATLHCLRYIACEAYVLEEFSEFLKTCIAEDVVRLDFW